MENLLLALSIARAQVKDLEWLVEQTENRLRENQNLLEQSKSMLNSLEKSEQEMKNMKSKSELLQIDLDRIAEKNRMWASKTVDRIMSSGMELPQQNLSYWKFEGPKLKEQVEDLTAQLLSAQEKIQSLENSQWRLG